MSDALGFDFSQYLVQGDLTTDGVQYSTEIETTTVNTDVVVFEYDFSLGFPDAARGMSDVTMGILWAYFEINCMFKCDADAGADIIWKAQARNNDGTWVDLFAATTYASIGTNYLEKTFKGYADLQTNFNEVPFDFRIIFQCDTVNEGRAQLKNTSYFRVVFKEQKP